MRLESLLIQDAHPAETAPFFKSRKDPFDNPVGSNARSGIAAVVDELLGGMDVQVITSFLDPLIRIRAVQTLFNASQAIRVHFPFEKSYPRSA